VAGARETTHPESKEDMHNVMKMHGYLQMYTPYGHDPSSSSQASYDACDAPAPSAPPPGTGPIVLSSGTEGEGEKQRFVNKVFKIMGYHKMYTLGPYSHDPNRSSQALGDSCDAPAPSNGPIAPSAVPRRGGRSFMAPMRGSAMLVRPGLVNIRVSAVRPYV
jgi:hypothetical protein